jgi:hypothetical protein
MAHHDLCKGGGVAEGCAHGAQFAIAAPDDIYAVLEET